jgi:hypothetical protein
MRNLFAVCILAIFLIVNGEATDANINASYDIGQNFLTIDFTLKNETGEDIAVNGVYFISIHAYNGSFYTGKAILQEEDYIKNTRVVFPNLKVGSQSITLTTIKSPTFEINTSDFMKLTGTKTGLKPDHIHKEPYGPGTITVTFHADDKRIFAGQTSVDFGRAGFGRAGLNGRTATYMASKLQVGYT